MSRRNVGSLGVAFQREGQVQSQDPERPPLLLIAGDTVLKVESKERDSNIPSRIARKFRQRGVELDSKILVHAPELVDGTTTVAVVAPVALGSAGYGDLAQTFTPP